MIKQDETKDKNGLIITGTVFQIYDPLARFRRWHVPSPSIKPRFSYVITNINILLAAQSFLSNCSHYEI